MTAAELVATWPEIPEETCDEIAALMAEGRAAA